MAEALLSPAGLRPFIANWEDVALSLLRSVQADALHDGTPETAELLKRLLALPDVAALARIPPSEEPQAPVLAIDFCQAGKSLRLFTTIATLGTPRHVTVQEIRVECFFPADDETAATFRNWAAAENWRAVTTKGSSSAPPRRSQP